MCYRIGARLAQRRILALDTLYHHFFSTPGRDATTINQLKHDLVLWLTHHSFEELPDALEYYLADPNSDLEGDLAHLTCLDPWGVQVHIHPLVTIYITTLLAWAKCFLATYGVYPGLYDLLDTPRLDFLAAQLHLRDSTLPRPLLHRSRGPPTIRSEYVALQPRLAPPPTRLSVRLSHELSVLQHVHLSCDPSVRHPDSTHSLSITPQVSRTVCPSHRQSVRHPRPSVTRTVHPPSRHSLHDSSIRHPTRQSCATSVRPSITVQPSVHHPTMSVRLSYVTPSVRPTNQSIRPSATVTPSVQHTTQSVSLSITSRLSDRHYDSSACTSVIPHDSPYPRLKPLPSTREWGAVKHDSPYTRLEPHPSSREWEQSRKAKKFPRAFTNYDLLLRALDASSIYLHDFRRVAPPKSGEDAHVTRGKCDFGGDTLNNPSLGCSYVLPQLWDPGGVSSSANTPRDLSRTLAPSRYPIALLTGYLISLPSLQRWQDLRMSHVKLDNFIHGNIAGHTTAMNKITGSINVIIPALTRPTPTHHERGNPYDRQSSRTNFNVTVTSYIRVTQNLKRCVERTSPYEGHTSRTFFARLLDPTSGLLRHTSGLPKILPRLCLTLLTMLGLWGVPYERPRLVNALELHLHAI